MLIALFVIALQGAWFGFVRPTKVLAWLAQASFVISAFLLIPIVVFVLHNQATSIEHLREFGIIPHPAIKHATGIANGQGENPIWVFDVNGEPQEILEFYRTAMANTRWEILEDNYLYLRLRSAEKNLTIACAQQVGASSLIISVNERHEQ